MSAKEYNRNLANRRRKDSYCLLPHKGQDSNKTFKQFDCVFGSNKGGSIICSKFVYMLFGIAVMHQGTLDTADFIHKKHSIWFGSGKNS